MTKKKRGRGRPKGSKNRPRTNINGYMSAKEAADRLGVCQRTFWRYLELGKVTGMQMVPKGTWRINAASVDALLNPPLD